MKRNVSALSSILFVALLIILPGCVPKTKCSLVSSSTASAKSLPSTKAASSPAGATGFTPCEGQKVPLCLSVSQELVLATLENNQITVTKRTGLHAYEALADDGWIYYNSPDNHSEIYRVKYDGTCNQLLTRDGGMNLLLCDKKLYFKNYRTGSISAIGLDGSGQKSYASCSVGQCAALGDWLYYTVDNGSGSGSSLYRIHADGSSKIELCDKTDIHCLTVNDGKLFFIAGTNLYQYDPASQTPRMLCDSGDFCFFGSDILCTGATQLASGSQAHDLYRYSPETEKRVKIADGAITSPVTYGGTVFYKADVGDFYAVSVGGGQAVKLNAEPFDSMLVLA